MEVWSLLSKCPEQILLDIDANTHEARKPLSTTTSTRNPHSPQVWSQISASGQWVEQFTSSLHMPRRKHQEHGSLERSIQILRTSTVENKNQHEALWPFCTRPTPLTWTRSSMPTTGCLGSGRSKSRRRCIRVEYPGKDHDRHKAIGKAMLATTCRLHKGLEWSQFHSLPHHQALHLVAGPVA